MLSDLLANITIGLNTALSPSNLLYCAIGVSLGTVAGIIPGIGALTTMSLLLPLTFHLDPTTALVMLAGIWYGTTYGGSTASILLNLPGTPSTAVTCIEGFPMAQSGRASVAMFMTTIASFVGATIGIIVMMLFSPLIVKMALDFGPVEYFSLMLLGLIAASTMSAGSTLKGLGMVGLGLLLGVVGIDVTSGADRFTFGVLELLDGISLVALAMGIFGVAQVIEGIRTASPAKLSDIKLTSMLPERQEMRAAWPAMLRGSGVGSVVGALPGVGPTVGAYMAYALEKKLAKDPSRFGNGAIEGLTAPESSNNAADQTAFIPTMTLGIPGSASMAIILGVLIIHGISPGPSLVIQQPELFWGLVMSFWIGNVLLLILNIPLIGLFVRILLIPYHYLYPAILAFICIGAFSLHNNPFDVLVVLVFGALGYIMRLLDFPPAPLLLGFVLGPIMEEHFRRALVLSQGSFDVFFTRPISLGCLVFTAAAIAYGIFMHLRERRAPTRV